MLGRSIAVQVWARPRPTDLRKGFRGLTALVRHEFHRDPRSGDLFLFVNRRRTSAKVLLWDATGPCIYHKRLIRGRFAKLWRAEREDRPLRLDVNELNLFLAGATRHERRAG